jgi:uncharacterized protein (TIGR00255 family)
MIQSMTGYGAASLDTEAFKASVSARSLNHRHLDVSLQTSRCLRSLEPELRSLIQSRVRRGRVELVVHASFLDQAGEVVVSSGAMVAGLVRTLREIHSQHGLEGGVRLSDVVRVPGVLEIDSAVAVSPEQRDELLEVVGRALDGLEAMRRSEGESLEAAVVGCLEAIESGAREVSRLSGEDMQARREALLEKLRGLCAELPLDEGRVYQETVRLVERSDVQEEVDRLLSHVSQARTVLEGDGASGKRLDFLAQELMREANTIGAKAASARLVHLVVGLKSEIERLREQVQNVE